MKFVCCKFNYFLVIIQHSYIFSDLIASLKMSEASASDSGGRIVKLEIRGLEECHFVKTLINGEVKKVQDLVEKLKDMMPELKDSEEIKIYQGKYLILQSEDMSIINLNEEVIVVFTKGRVQKKKVKT